MVNKSDSVEGSEGVFKVDGTAEVIDGQLRVSNPKGEGKSAIIIDSEGVTIKVNGEELKDKTNVYEEDEIELILHEEHRPASASVSFSSDMMEAVLEVMPEYELKYILVEQPPKSILKVNAKKIENFISPVGEDEIYEVFANENLVYGIDEEVVKELAGSLKPESKVVAVGDPMVEGKDGYVVYKVTTEKEMIEYEEEADQVNYRERFTIPQVSEGDVMAAIYPPEEGIPGRQVDGEEVPPPPVNEADVVCKEGVSLSRDGSQVIATQKGRPVIKAGKQHIIGVEKYYVHVGDVSMESGNVSFQGHLKVEGAVHEGMSVFADNDIVITKNTAGATITAGGNITIGGNCINSQVNAGGLQLILLEIGDILSYFKVSLEVAIETLEQLVEAFKSKGGVPATKFPKLLQSLLMSKFPEVFDFSNQFKNIMKEQTHFQLPQEILDRLSEVVAFFAEDGILEAIDERVMVDMLRNVEEAYDIIGTLTEARADITVLYVQNSDLRCTGDIFVNGPGAYNSNFECGGKVKVVKLFRGGNIKADDDVTIGELGSPGTSISSGVIQVSEGHGIRVGKVHEGSKLKMGDRTFRLDSTYSNIKIYVDPAEDKVKVVYWK